MAYSGRLKEILGEPDGILAGVSGNKAALRVARTGGELSPNTILQMKNDGVWGRIDSVRTLARAYAPELAERHKDEIALAFPNRTSTSMLPAAWEALAVDWLAFVATSGQFSGGVIARVDGGAASVTEPSPTRSEAFASTFQRLCGDRTPAEIARRVRRPEEAVQRALDGWPPTLPVLVSWAADLDLTADEANDLLQSAGQEGWNPARAYRQAWLEVVNHWGLEAWANAEFDEPEKADLAALSPRACRQLIDRLEVELFETVREGALHDREARYLGDTPHQAVLSAVQQELGPLMEALRRIELRLEGVPPTPAAT